jgi:hypothetical protein
MFIQNLKDVMEESELLRVAFPSFVELIPRSLNELQVYMLRRWALKAVFTTEGLILITDSFKKNENVSGKYVAFPAFHLVGTDVEYPLNTIKMDIPDGKLLNIHGIHSFLGSFFRHIRNWGIFPIVETRLRNCGSDASHQIDTILNEESKTRIGWTTKTVQTALTFKDSLWNVVIVPHNKELMSTLQMVPLDSKPLSEALSAKINSLTGKPYSILINTLDCIISLSLMPMMVLRDFIQLTRWESASSTSNLGTEWVFFVPEEAHLDFISYEKTFPFLIDRKTSVIYFVVIIAY